MEDSSIGAHGSSGRRRELHGMVGQSDVMHRVFDAVRDLGPSEVPLLITGETGTGKTLCARVVHELYGPTRPFVPVNCAGLEGDLLRSELFGHRKGAFTGAHREHTGLLAEADGGILFLDEVGDLEGAAQAKLLDALEEGRYRPVGASEWETAEVRIVSATHRDVDELVERGDFRRDLRHRLGVATIEIPPLRRRREDVPLLARMFLRAARGDGSTASTSFSPDALAALSSHTWPGNVRQLREAVRLAAVMVRRGEAIGSDVVRSVVRDGAERGTNGRTRPLDFDAAVERAKRTVVRTALACTDGHRGRAADLLGIGTSTLYRTLASDAASSNGRGRP